ncbi:MAG: hypothetical protein R3293_24600, partial [Candidatus Promineifilaceae bacterium]|nr:hypothetical protein [Candidatus Promineifilaceae bacterium]
MGYEEAEIKSLVRQIVTRTLGESGTIQPTTDRMDRRTIIDEEAVRLMPAGSLQIISKKSLLTPLARQVALERRIRFETTPSGHEPAAMIAAQTSNESQFASSAAGKEKRSGRSAFALAKRAPTRRSIARASGLSRTFIRRSPPGRRSSAA